MSESVFKMAEGTKVPEEFICPISQTIMSDPVFNDEGTTFDRKAIEQWIDKNGTDPFTRKPLSKKDLRPNRALRDGIYKFVQGLSKKQKEQLQYLNVYQVAKLREKQFEQMGYITPQNQKDFIKLQRQLEIYKNQLFIQRQQKEFAISQCELQKKNAAINSNKLSAWQHQMTRIKKSNQQQLKKHERENRVLSKEIFELRELQKMHLQEIEESQKMLKNCQCENKLVQLTRKVKLTPDTKSMSFKKRQWKLNSINKNICIANINGPNWLCSSSLPANGEFVFSIKFIERTASILIGLMDSNKKGDRYGDTWKHRVCLYPSSQTILRANEEQTMHQCIKTQCSSQLPNCPFQIECHVNRQSNTIAWHYAGKQQAKCTMPNAWKTQTKQLCAIVWVQKKNDTVQMIDIIRI